MGIRSCDFQPIPVEFTPPVLLTAADTLEDSFVSEGAVKKEKPNTPYCPVGNQDARAPDREPRRSDVTNCSSVNLSVENESGASVIVLWVNGEGQEVRVSDQGRSPLCTKREP